jgi:hypothetical protein
MLIVCIVEADCSPLNKYQCRTMSKQITYTLTILLAAGGGGRRSSVVGLVCKVGLLRRGCDL